MPQTRQEQVEEASWFYRQYGYWPAGYIEDLSVAQTESVRDSPQKEIFPKTGL